MNEFVNAVGEWFANEWGTSLPDDMTPQLCEYVIGPGPVSDSLFDEGDGD